MGRNLGRECKLYHGVAGAAASTEMRSVKNVDIDMSHNMIPVNNRGTGVWNAQKPGLKDGSISLSMAYDEKNADFQALQTAFFNQTPLAIRATSKDGDGIEGDFYVSKFARTEPLDGEAVVNVELVPTFIDGEGGRTPQPVTGGVA